jgi:hypothetical protein
MEHKFQAESVEVGGIICVPGAPSGRAPFDWAKVLLICRVAVAVAAGVLLVILVFAALQLWPVAQRVNQASATLLDCKGHAACLPSEVLATVGSLKAMAGAGAKAAPEVAQAAKDASRYSVEASKQASETAQEAKALLTDLRGLVGDLRATTNGLQTDLAQLTASADGALAPLADALKKIGALTDTLNDQIKTGSPKATQTFDSLNRAIADFSKLLEDPNIQAILASSAKTSDHLANSAESLDIAMRPWRERAHLLKTILEKAAGMIKLVIPLPW